jgi:hypothetical protein
VQTKSYFITKASLLREIVAVHSTNRVEHVNRVRVQNVEYISVKVSGLYSNRGA